MNKAVFLDKDGTLIEDLPYNVDPKLMRLAPRALEALLLLQAHAYRLFVVSNQSGVACGLFEEGALPAVWRQLNGLLPGVEIEDFYYCPHHPCGTVPQYAQSCECRKPAPGMLLRAAAEWKLSLAKSWMVGDILNDVEAGRRAGCRTVLLDNGNETEWLMSPLREPHLRVPDLYAAAQAIVTADDPAPAPVSPSLMERTA